MSTKNLGTKVIALVELSGDQALISCPHCGQTCEIRIDDASYQVMLEIYCLAHGTLCNARFCGLLREI